MLSIGNLNINDTPPPGPVLPDNADYIDITDKLFGSLKSITDSKVVKSELFDLLDGTRAIEVTNAKLDTGLIPLSEQEIDFDTAAPLDFASVVAIQNKLFVSFMSWLNNSSLPVTVLSSRYVQTLLSNYLHYKNQPDMRLAEKCSLVNERIPASKRSQLSPEVLSSVEFHLVHKVLKSFIMGLCKFVGTCLYVAVNVLYEEEDLTTRNMNLDFLQDVDSEFILKELNASIAWLGKNCGSHKDEAAILINHLTVLVDLTKIETIFYTPVDLFDNNGGMEDSPLIDSVQFLKEGSSTVQQLISSTYEIGPVPPASFSRFIQLDLDNKNIPFDLYEIPAKDAWDNLASIFEDIYSFTIKGTKVSSHNEFINYLKYDVSHRIHEFSVISRGVLQLFLVRDDKTVYGDPTLTLNAFTIDSVENIAGKLTTVLHLGEQNLSSLKEEVKLQVGQRLAQLISELESGVYHNLTTYGNNPCRQQQLISRGLLVWDNLQVSWESFEVELHQMFKIGDELLSGGIALPVSSFVYYTKLNMMIDLALNGLNLEIYKSFELYLIYWYSTYLIQILIEHIQGRLTQVIEAKISYIEKTFPKKIKKAKAGPKKEQLKATNQYNHDVILPSLIDTQNYNSIYLLPSLSGMNDLIDANRIFMIVLSSLNLIDFLTGPKNSLTQFENLFNLRLKPWSSIGVPSLPTYSQYQSSLDLKLFSKNSKVDYRPLLKLIEDKLVASKDSHTRLLKDIQENELIKGQFKDTSDSMVKWYNDLVRTSICYSIEIKNLIKLADSFGHINLEGYHLDISEGYHKYFPKINIRKQNDVDNEK